jgi:hypothetical protein
MSKVKKIILILILVIILIILVVGIIALVIKGGNVKSLFGGLTGSDKYFLVYVMTGNGSASYYGQIAKETDDYIILKDPGYINIQPAQKEGEQAQVTYNFMKDEFFKPVSELKIYKDKVVFVQELTNDSPIVNFYKQQLGK